MASGKTRLERTALAKRIRACTRCGLHGDCTQPVPGEGPKDAAVVFLARNPGETEDKQNRPLVGKAGSGPFQALLDKFELPREAVGLINTVSCFTVFPKNRVPTPEEIEACSSNLKEQLEFFKRMRLLVPMGNEATKAVLGPKAPGIMQLEGTIGKTVSYPGVAILPLRHPAAFLRDPSDAKRFGRLVLPNLVRRVRRILEAEA